MNAECSIRSIHAREILDSRGNPTIETDIILDDGSFGRASVPRGASTGRYEAKELRDGGGRYKGKGVVKAIANINGELAGILVNKSFDQGSFDSFLIAADGTPDKSRFGANALLSLSLAFARARAASYHISLYRYLSHEANEKEHSLLPLPMMNVLNGGRHADRSTDFQEYMIVPGGFHSFSEALRAGVETYHALKELLQKRNLPTTVGDEGGFAPPLKDNEEPFTLLLEAIQHAGYKPGEHISLAIDAAASEFFKDNAYTLASEKTTLSANELAGRYETYAKKYPLVSIEDPFSEDDFENTAHLTKIFNKKVQIVGDDLFATNTSRLVRGIREKAGSAILIKVNQIGTLTETLEAVKTAKKAGFGTICSHRSGETEDVFISHLAVGLSLGQIKTGAPTRSERTAKYNELIRIEEELGRAATFAGSKALSF